MIKRSSTSLPWLVVALSLLLFSPCRANDLPFDPDIRGWKLVKLIGGDEAVRAIDRLHGTPIDVLRGYIAHYGGGGGEATIWVSEAASQEAAQEQIDVMIHKMKGNPKSPFDEYRSLEKKGSPVIGFRGLGQAHYVFRTGRWVYWVSANKDQIDAILLHLLK